MHPTARPLYLIPPEARRRAVASVPLVLALTLGLSLAASAQNKPTTNTPSAPAGNPPLSSAQPPAAPVGPLKLVYAGKPVAAPAPTAVPFRDPTDNAICIPPEMLEPLGIVYVQDVKANRVTLTTTDGTAVTTVVPRTALPGTPASGYPGVFIPAEETIKALGGRSEYEAATNTLYARSVVKGVEVVDGRVIVHATLPVLPMLTRADDGKTLIIDLPGADAIGLPKTLPTDAPTVAQIRVGQFESDTARVVVEFKAPVRYTTDNPRPATALTFSPVGSKAPLAAPPTPTKKPTGVAANPPARKPSSRPSPKATPTPLPPAVVRTVEFRNFGDDRAEFVVRVERTPMLSANQAKGHLALDLGNVTLGADVGKDLPNIKHPFLRGATITAAQGNYARLNLDLTRIVAFTVKPDGQGNIVLDLFMPKSAGGRLAGKLVVVDAGHGGGDRGAPGVNGTHEKDVNLAIAFQVAEQLKEAGANVIMTRATDFFVPLYDRPKMANQAGADFFISVHANDSGNGNHGVNGSIVFYHSDNTNCRALAQCIAERFENMGSIRSLGFRSDYAVYKGQGFAVLRASRMVGVLVETGFMTNANDARQLNNPDVQKKIGGAIVAGLRDYIEGNPDYDTRENTPNAGSGPTLLLPLEAVPVPTGAMPPAEGGAGSMPPSSMPTPPPAPTPTPTPNPTP